MTAALVYLLSSPRASTWSNLLYIQSDRSLHKTVGIKILLKKNTS